MTTWFAIPKGTPQGKCRSCRAAIYWVTTPMGKSMPVDVAVPDGVQPTREKDGRGISHFATCPQADEHRRPKRQQELPL